MWRPAATPGLELVWAQQGWYGAPAHAHEELELSVAPLHARTLEVNGRAFEVPAGAVSVVLPGELHRTTVQEGANVFYSVRIHPEALHELRLLPRLPVAVPDVALARAVLRLHRQAGHAPGLDPAALGTHLRALLSLLVGRAGARVGDRVPAPPVPSVVAAARAGMEEAPGDAFPLTGLARQAGLSPSHFARLFRAGVGLSPHASLLDARIRRAKALLTGDEPLAQVALALGFTSQSHFAGAFRQRVGVSPHQFRQDSRILVDREGPWAASSRHDEP